MNIEALVLIIIIIHSSLSILFFVGAVKNEAYEKYAPGSLLLKATAVLNIAIVPALFCLALLFAVRPLDFGLLLAFTCYHIFLGILGIKRSRSPKTAKLLRNLSIISMLMSIFLYFWFPNTSSLGYIRYGFVPAFCFINSVLFCVGAIKNSLYSPPTI